MHVYMYFEHKRICANKIDKVITRTLITLRLESFMFVYTVVFFKKLCKRRPANQNRDSALITANDVVQLVKITQQVKR